MSCLAFWVVFFSGMVVTSPFIGRSKLRAMGSAQFGAIRAPQLVGVGENTLMIAHILRCWVCGGAIRCGTARQPAVRGSADSPHRNSCISKCASQEHFERHVRVIPM